MIRWGEEKRCKDHGYFCRMVASGPGSEKPVWIISDVRRRTDLQYFTDNCHCCIIKVRVMATEKVRQLRGWSFTEGMSMTCRIWCDPIGLWTNFLRSRLWAIVAFYLSQSVRFNSHHSCTSGFFLSVVPAPADQCYFYKYKQHRNDNLFVVVLRTLKREL